MAKKYSYRMYNEFGTDWVYRREEDDETLEDKIWDYKTKAWKPSSEASGAFAGFEPSKVITEAEAKKIIGEDFQH